MEITMICNQLDSIQSILPAAPPSPVSAIAPVSATSFVHSTAASAPPPLIPDLTPAERAELERIARCNPRRAAQPKKSLKEADHSDTEQLFDEKEGTIISLPHINNSTRLLAFDGTHVLVGDADAMVDEDAKPKYWVPYMFMRYGCRALSRKAVFEAKLMELRKAPANPDHSALPRIAINELRPVKYMHYYPRDERVLYLIGGAKGLAALKDLADTPALKEFVCKRKALIEELKAEKEHDRARIVKKLGLHFKHDDVTPQLDESEEYDFIFAPARPEKKRARVHFESTVVGPAPKKTCAEAARTTSETEVAAILLEMMSGRK